MSIDVERYMEKFWGYFAFLANSLVFILMGLLFTSLFLSLNIPILPILVIILSVVIARAISIYTSIGIVNQIKYEDSVPLTWQHLMAWGSLRGSLAVIMVLLIPDDVSLSNWPYEFSIKEFLIAATIGSIYFTLIIKAPTIEKLVRWLKLDELLPHEQLSYYKSKALIYHDITNRIDELFNHDQINARQYKKFKQEYQALYQQAKNQYRDHNAYSSHVVENVLRIYTLSLQKHELKKMFERNEITERIYKRNLDILQTQTERVEQDRPKLKSINEYLDSWANVVKKFFRRLFLLPVNKEEAQELYLYYRTQYKLINSVLDHLSKIGKSPLTEIFNDELALQNVVKIYENLKSRAIQDMQHQLTLNRVLLDELNEQSAKALFHAAQDERLKELHDNEIITSKLYFLLMNEFKHGK